MGHETHLESVEIGEVNKLATEKPSSPIPTKEELEELRKRAEALKFFPPEFKFVDSIEQVDFENLDLTNPAVEPPLISPPFARPEKQAHPLLKADEDIVQGLDRFVAKKHPSLIAEIKASEAEDANWLEKDSVEHYASRKFGADKKKKVVCEMLRVRARSIRTA